MAGPVAPARDVLSSDRPADLVTVNADGSPQVSCGPGVRFPPMDDPPPGYVVRIAVERVGGVGPVGMMPVVMPCAS